MANGWIDRLGWTLIHFAWQGAAVALVLAMLLWMTRSSSSGLRYGLACMALALLVALPIVTFFSLGATASLPTFESSRGATFSLEETIVGDPSPTNGTLTLLVGIWAAGVLVLSARLAGSLFQVERWKRRNTSPVDSEWQERVDVLSRRLGISLPVRVLMSDRIHVPSAWGVLKAVIVMPTSLLTQLPPDQVETILLHELAHIRRHDYLINLFQTVVETVLFYHPAVWWVSSVVRREREHCCDDVVVRSLSDPMPYARALFTLEERRLTLPHPTLSAKGSHLMNRIARILGAKPAPSRISPIASTLAALGIAGAVLGGTLQAQAQAETKKPTASAATPAKAVKRKIVKGVKKGAKPVPAKRIQGVKIVSTKAVPANGVEISAVVTGSPAQVIGVRGTQVRMVRGKVVPATPASSVIGKKIAPAQQAAPARVDGKPAKTVEGSFAAIGNDQGPTFTGQVSVGNAFAGQAGGLGGSVVSVSAGSGGFGGGSTAVSGQAVGGGFGGSVVTAVSAASSDEPSVEFDKGNRMVSIDVKGDFRGGSFTATMRKLAKLTKTSVVIDAGLYMDVTLVISDKSVEDAIEILCRSAKATYKLERGVYYISSTYVPGK